MAAVKEVEELNKNELQNGDDEDDLDAVEEGENKDPAKKKKKKKKKKKAGKEPVIYKLTNKVITFQRTLPSECLFIT